MAADNPFAIPPPPEEAGIAGIGLRRSRGAQPSGIREALGYGLLGASDIASEALPGFLQSAGQAPNAGAAFGGGLGLGLLSSLGDPARKTVAQEEKHREAKLKLQSTIIEKGMQYMDQESLNKLFAIGGIDAQVDPKTMHGSLYNQSIRALWQAMLRRGQSPENIQEIGEALSQDPTLAPILEGLDIEQTPSGALEWFWRAKGIYTPESFDAVTNPSSPDYGDVSKFKVKEGKTAGGNSFSERYFNDTQTALKKIAEEKGFVGPDGQPNLDAARPFYFKGNTDAEALYDKVLGKSSATPQSIREKALRLAKQTDPFFSMKPEQEQERQLRLLEKQLQGGTPQASPRAAGYKPRQPDQILDLRSMGGSSPEAIANRKTMMIGYILSEYGLLSEDAEPTVGTILGVYNSISFDPALKQQIDDAVNSAIQGFKARKTLTPMSPQAMKYLQRLGVNFVPSQPLPGMVPPGMEGEDQTIIEPEAGEE